MIMQHGEPPIGLDDAPELLGEPDGTYVIGVSNVCGELVPISAGHQAIMDENLATLVADMRRLNGRGE